MLVIFLLLSVSITDFPIMYGLGFYISQMYMYMVYAGSSSINKDYTKKEKLVNSSHRQTAICNLTRLT